MTLKRVVIILVVVLGGAIQSLSQTQLYSSHPGGVWTKKGSPYIINGTVTIESNLIIKPGVWVIFNYENGLRSRLYSPKGYIHAIGAVNDSIVFSSQGELVNTHDRFGFYHEDSMSCSNIFKYCVFEYDQGPGYTPMPSNSDVCDTIMYSNFRNTNITIYLAVHKGDLYISDCNIYSVKYAFLGADDSLCNMTMERCHIWNGWTGGMWQSPGTFCMRNCEIHGMTGVALYFFVPPRVDKPLKITIGGDPLYCNKFYNNNLVLNDGNKNIRVQAGSDIDARYNYWGTIEIDSVTAAIYDTGQCVPYIPFNDENCKTVIVGVDEPDPPAASNMILYPSPAKRSSPVTMAFEVMNGSDMSVQVYDILGNIVRNENLGHVSPGRHIYNLDVSELPPGAYMYMMTSPDSNPITGRFIVANQ